MDDTNLIKVNGKVPQKMIKINVLKATFKLAERKEQPMNLSK